MKGFSRQHGYDVWEHLASHRFSLYRWTHLLTSHGRPAQNRAPFHRELTYSCHGCFFPLHLPFLCCSFEDFTGDSRQTLQWSCHHSRPMKNLFLISSDAMTSSVAGRKKVPDDRKLKSKYEFFFLLDVFITMETAHIYKRKSRGQKNEPDRMAPWEWAH